MPWLSSFLVNPLLAVLGAGLVSVPILIHLLNKRKFKVIDWAAMDFLMDADQRNRRRLRLENLLLLLLRCLAVLLIGFLLGRPFLNSAWLPGGKDGGQFERIVLLDDSLSMQVRTGDGSALDDAKQQLIEMVHAFANNHSDDALTLVLTSHPERTMYNSRRIGRQSIEEIEETIRSLEISHTTANLDVALQNIQQHIASQPKNVNRVVYFFTDMRRHDWSEQHTDDSENHPVQLLRNMSNELNGCFLVDVGRQEYANITVTDIQPAETLIAGVSSRFDVTVANTGNREVHGVKVNFYSGQSLPLETDIEKIAPGATETVAFRFNHAMEDVNELKPSLLTQSLKVRAEAVAENSIDDDRLADDSQRYFAARVVRGIPTLIVDGDPSADKWKSESTFLNFALAPVGDVLSGVLAKVATETELENVDLDQYKVIFLCNVYRLSEKRIEALEKWTADGGGLVILPGDQVDDVYYNKWLHRDGKGLSPIRLEELLGDESRRTWVNFKVEAANHPVLRLFEGEKNNPILNRIKTFRWWGSTVLPEQQGRLVSVPMRFTDVDNSSAIVEKAFGKGRVVALTIPADDAWSNWSQYPSYFVTMQELVRYLSTDSPNNAIRVGETIRQPLDLTQHDRHATLLLPDNKRISTEAVADDLATSKVKQAIWYINHPETTRRGFYDFELTRKRGGTEHVLYAANIDPREGNLKRLDQADLHRKLAGANVTLISGEKISQSDIRGSQSEWWQNIWGVLLGVLCLESFLGWWFGRRR